MYVLIGAVSFLAGLLDIYEGASYDMADPANQPPFSVSRLRTTGTGANGRSSAGEPSHAKL